MTTTICPACGMTFTKRRANHIHCSANCTLKLHRARQKTMKVFHHFLTTLTLHELNDLVVPAVTEQGET